MYMGAHTCVNTQTFSKFYILLTVHHAVSLGKWPTWRTDSFLCIYFFFNIFQPAQISATNIEWLLPEAVLIQFVFPDDEHDVLETCREL
jgi:hypothetical protein